MALPKTIDRVENLPELAREHYAQKEGVWTLTLLAPEEYAGLISALDRERKARRDADTAHAELKQRYEGIDPTEYKTMQERLAGLKDKEIYDKEGLESLVGRRMQQAQAEHQRIVQAKDRELGQFKIQNGDLERRWRGDRLRTNLTEAIVRAGVKTSSHDDALRYGLEIFTDLDEAGLPVAKKGEDIQYGKDGVTPLTPYDWLIGLKPSKPDYWPSSGGGGASSYHVNGPGGITDWTKITSPTERLTAFRAAQKAGTKG